MPAGLFTVSCVPPALTEIVAVTLVVPKYTAVAPVSVLPLTVTAVPPAAGPLAGETPATAGTGLVNL